MGVVGIRALLNAVDALLQKQSIAPRELSRGAHTRALPWSLCCEHRKHDRDTFFWSSTGNHKKVVEYSYDRDAYNDDPAHSYKLWKTPGRDVDDNAGFYKVSLNCDYDSGDKPMCWLDFICLLSWVDDEVLFGDC